MIDFFGSNEEIKEAVRKTEEMIEEICKDCPMKCNKKGCVTSDESSV